MRQWYEIDFTPDSALNKSKHYDSVTNLLINGETLETHDRQVIKSCIDRIVKELEQQSGDNITLSGTIEIVKSIIKNGT